jgi:hypothetical protein
MQGFLSIGPSTFWEKTPPWWQTFQEREFGKNFSVPSALQKPRIPASQTFPTEVLWKELSLQEQLQTLRNFVYRFEKERPSNE